jgi:hypothetical protein
VSGIGTGEVAGGIVASLAIIALFVGAIVLSKRDYSLTATFKLAPRALPRQSAAAAAPKPGAEDVTSPPSSAPVPAPRRLA